MRTELRMTQIENVRIGPRNLSLSTKKINERSLIKLVGSGDTVYVSRLYEYVLIWRTKHEYNFVFVCLLRIIITSHFNIILDL